MARLFEGLGKIGGMAVDALSNGAQPFRAVVNGIHRGHDGEKNLCRANVAGGLVAADMLLPGLECQAQRRVAGGILGNANEAAGKAALVLITRSKEGGVWPAEAGSNPTALAGSYNDIRSAFARWLEKGNRQKIRRNDGQGA